MLVSLGRTSGDYEVDIFTREDEADIVGGYHMPSSSMRVSSGLKRELEALRGETRALLVGNDAISKL